MRIWFDTEFLEDGRTIELISIGLVREDGATLYCETPQAKGLAESTAWLRENVLPGLELRGPVLERVDIARKIVEFAGDRPEFWAYFCSYDWVALCQLFGTMMDLPGGWPMWCRDLKHEASRLSVTDLPAQLDGKHNALADALWTRKAWEYVQKRA